MKAISNLEGENRVSHCYVKVSVKLFNGLCKADRRKLWLKSKAEHEDKFGMSNGVTRGKCSRARFGKLA